LKICLLPDKTSQPRRFIRKIMASREGEERSREKRVNHPPGEILFSGQSRSNSPQHSLCLFAGSKNHSDCQNFGMTKRWIQMAAHASIYIFASHTRWRLLPCFASTDKLSTSLIHHLQALYIKVSRLTKKDKHTREKGNN